MVSGHSVGRGIGTKVLLKENNPPPPPGLEFVYLKSVSNFRPLINFILGRRKTFLMWGAGLGLARARGGYNSDDITRVGVGR